MKFKIFKGLFDKKQVVPLPLDRAKRALDFKQNAVNDFFGGWELEDLKRLEPYKCPEVITPAPNEIVDWLGIRTDASLHSWLGDQPKGVRISELPIPDDQIHAETIEYVALVESLERALSNNETQFTCFEIGSSCAPWATAAAIISKRIGFEKVRVLALEANEAAINSIYKHWKRNNLRQDSAHT